MIFEILHSAHHTHITYKKCCLKFFLKFCIQSNYIFLELQGIDLAAPNMKLKLFFTVNTPGAELLYGIVKEWCDKDKEDSCVLGNLSKDFTVHIYFLDHKLETFYQPFC